MTWRSLRGEGGGISDTIMMTVGHLGRGRGDVGLDFGMRARPRGVYGGSWDRSLDTLGEHACAPQKVQERIRTCP